jgi:choline dehydrogenase-like flavoprotein
MLIDALSLEPGAVLTARYCVVGSGMGGAAVAQKLAAAGLDVLIVEAGGLDVRSAPESAVTADHIGRDFNMPLTRCIELGGTSNQWHGICAPLDRIDFEARPWIPGSGWPISRCEMNRAYGEAAAMLGVPGEGHFETGDLAPPLAERLKDFDANPSIVDRKLVHFKKPPMRWKETLTRLARAGTFRCVINAAALELIVGDNGSTIEELIVGADGRTLTIRADVFIVCAGALETPRLLLNSRRRHAEGIGNAHDLVGRNLLDHPVGHYCKLRFHRPTRAPLYASQPLSGDVGMMAGVMMTPEQQRAHRLANHYLWIRPSVSAARIDDELLLSFLAVRGVRDLSLRQIVAILTNRDIAYRILVHRFGIRPKFVFGDLFFMTEQLPNRDSRVGLSERRDGHQYPVAAVNWQLLEQDISGFLEYARLLFEQGLRSQQHTLARVDDPAIWNRTLASAAHHLGTARMAARAEDGVVDRNLQVFGTSNLFVCDGSVFATAGSVNPSLTITALAVRLAEHLVARQAA